MMNKPEVCVIPVAGLSTRNLPATKALHKGFLTLNSRPIIQYAVDACAEIGIKEIVFIYSDQACKYLYETYFSRNESLENSLEKAGKHDLLKVLKEVLPEGMKFSFAEQKQPLGNGHAVLQAREIVGKRDFVVMWADDVYLNLKNGEGILKQLLNVYNETGGIVENIVECSDEEIVRYGVLVNAKRDGNKVSATGMIEKPARDKIPSNYGVLGPYILPNSIMDVLPEVSKGTNGEINLADAIGLAAERGMKMTGVLCDIERFDCGTNEELAKADIKLKVIKEPNLREFTKNLMKSF